MPANEDDDDNNNVMDSEQADPAPAGEDDLKGVSVSCGTLGTLRLSCSGCSRVRLWKNANRTEPLDLGPCWSSCEPNCQPLANRPTIIYVEGIQASDVDGDVVLSAKFVKRDAACTFECICTDSAPLTVVSLKEGSLTWEVADDTGNPDLGNCDNNGGKKIFPDLINPTDGANAAKRRTVDLVATIKPRVKGATVYFKVWDVDDPFDQVNGMPNVSILDPDNPTTGPDNRGAEAVALPWTTSKATEANGKARVQFTVSMQPGDNYRAGGSVNSDAPSQADQPKADAADDEFVGKPGDFAEYKVPLTWSPMLTVWRHLWIERDTMAAPDPANIRVLGAIIAIYPTPGRPGLTTLKIGNPINASFDLNNYEGGWITFTGCPSGSDRFQVAESYPGSDSDGIPHELVLVGLPGSCAAVGSGYTLFDDDDLSVLGSTSAPHFPDGGQLLLDAFKPAYIFPIYAGAEYQDIVPFDPYLGYWDILRASNKTPL